MMRRLVLRDFAAYGVGLLLYKLLQLVLIPIVARGLVPAEFGALEILLVTSTLVTACSEFNFQLAVGTLIHGSAREQPHSAIAAAIASNLLLSAFTIGVVILAAPWIVAHVPSLQGRHDLLVLAALNGAFSGMTHLYATIWQLQFRPSRYNQLFLGGAALSLVFTLSWLALDDAPRSAAGPIVALTAANGLTSLFGLWTFGRMINLRSSKVMLRGLWLIAVPLAPFSVASWTLASIDRYILAAFRDPVEVGMFAAAARIAAIASVAFAPFQAAWYPRALAAWSTSDRDRTFGEAVDGLVGLGGMFVAALALASPLLIDLLLSSKYLAADRAAVLLVCGSWLGALLYVPLATLMAAGHSGRVSIAYLVAAGVSCIANLALVPVAGTAAAAWTAVVAQTALVVTLFAFASRSQRYQFPGLRLAGVFAAIVFVSWAAVSVRGVVGAAWYTVIASCAWIALLYMLKLSGWISRESLTALRRRFGARS